MRRTLLLPFVPLYGTILSLKRRLFAGKANHLARPVISVGSLSAGGAGKTPVVIALVDLLLKNGYEVDVLSRGYGRNSTSVERVDPKGTANRFGDEPLELARRSGVPVYVGGDRHAAGALAEQEAEDSPKLIHVLDDGFQHQRLARDLDLVLLTEEDVNDFLLPAGNLREPLHRLKAAGAIILREEEVTTLLPVVANLVGTDMPLWILRRRLEVPADLALRPLAFCGLARPGSFFAMLRGEGVVPAETVAFRDHHPYTYRDVTRLVDLARTSGADGFVSTEKDAVKLTEVMRRRLAAVGPLAVARLSVEIVDEPAALAQIATAAASRADRMRR